KALEKLIAALEQAIKNKNKNEVESQSKKLQEFVNSQVDYKKLAYEKKRDEVQRLLDQAKNYSTQNSQNNEGFFRPNNPLMWVSGVAVVGIVAGAILIIRSRKRKAARNIAVSKREIKQPPITFRVKAKQEEPKIINLEVYLEKLTAQLSDGRELSIPIDWFAKWGVKGINANKLKNYEIKRGKNIYFPNIDEVLGMEVFIHGFDAP
ncbi:21560_t:CDS:2, partial [Racocetra persica]